MSYMEVDKHCLEDFLRDLQPFPFWFFTKYVTGTSNDMFDSFIIEDVSVVAVVNVVAAKVGKMLFRCFRRRFLGGCSDTLSECIELDREGGVNSMLCRKFSIGSLANIVDFASIGSESMPK